MEQDLKRLPESLQPKGTGIPGLTSTLVQRTDKVAWYLRNDGYHEVFLIKIGRTFDLSGLMEYYPAANDFGKSAWCIREHEDAMRYYSNLCLGRGVNERTVMERYKNTAKKKKHKMRPPQLQKQEN